MKEWSGVNIKIGKGAVIDEDVILGYPSGRLKKTKKAVILGTGARIRSGSVIYQEVSIGRRFETGHNVIVREENLIGDDVSVWANTTIDYGCRIGNRVKIHTGVYLAQYTILEDDVFIAPGTIFGNDKYPVSTHLEGPRIRKGARLGVNVTILPGITVGRNSLVGAGSVVTRDVPDGTVVIGNPAHVVQTIAQLDRKRKNLRGAKIRR